MVFDKQFLTQRLRTVDILMFEYGRRPDVIGPVFEIMAYKAQPEDVRHYVIVFANYLLYFVIK